MKISEIINEAFDSQVNGVLVRATNDTFTTKAEIGGRVIIFNAASYTNATENGHETVWELEFTEKTTGNRTYGKTGSGNEMQVFSFVLESIKELIARYQPDVLEFSADKGDGNRSNLYARIASRVKIPGYTYYGRIPDKYADKFLIKKDT